MENSSPSLAATPQAHRGNVAALIPAYFEARSIQEVARRVQAALDTVLVVDDGSSDDTEKEALLAGVRVLRHAVNQGKGAAIKTGLGELTLSGKFQYILILDGDGQHLPEEIPRFLDEANESGAALILGNRMSDTRTMPFVRRMTNRFMSWQISRVCGQSMPDTQCGFRMISAQLAPALFTESNNYDYETEMLIIAARRGFRIASVPVSTVYGEEKSKIHPLRDTIRFFELLSRYKKNVHAGSGG